MYKENNLAVTVKIMNGMIRDYICGQIEHSPDRNRMMWGWIMDYLYYHGEDIVYQKELEMHFHQPKSTIATILKKMEKEGVISRLPDEKDTRLKRVILSEEGRKRHELVLKHFKELEQNMLLGISGEDRKTFFRVSDQIIENLEGIQKGKE